MSENYSDLTKRPYVVLRPTLYNVIFLTILDDVLNIRVLSSHFKPLGTIFPKEKVGEELIRDVERWRQAWPVIYMYM